MVLLCSECEGPFRYWEDEEGVHHACMCSDPRSPIIERLTCRQCGGHVELDESLDTDPMACECSSDDRPAGYRMLSREESIERAAEFLS